MDLRYFVRHLIADFEAVPAPAMNWPEANDDGNELALEEVYHASEADYEERAAVFADFDIREFAFDLSKEVAA